MEPVRFADILFILLVSLVTFGILKLVNRKQAGGKKDRPAVAEPTDVPGSADKPTRASEDN